MLQEVYSINPQLRIVGSAATGYGEELVKNAFSMDEKVEIKEPQPEEHASFKKMVSMT